MNPWIKLPASQIRMFEQPDQANPQTEGPLRVAKDRKYGEQSEVRGPRGCVAVARAGFLGGEEESARAEELNAALIAAAYTAFDGAARRLGVNAIQLARALGADGLVTLIKAYNLSPNFTAELDGVTPFASTRHDGLTPDIPYDEAGQIIDDLPEPSAGEQISGPGF